MYDFSNLLTRETIFDPLMVDSRQGALRELSEALAARAGLDGRDVLEAVIERERLGSTGVGDGVAIPHVRLHGLTTSVGAFARLGTPVDFDAIDDKPCDLIFMLLAPESEGSDHLRALAQVSRSFRHQDFRALLRAPADERDLRELLLSPGHIEAA